MLQKRWGKVSLTADIWSSPIFKGYMAVIAYWLDTNWDLKSTVLELKRFHTPHTGDAK